MKKNHLEFHLNEKVIFKNSKKRVMYVLIGVTVLIWILLLIIKIFVWGLSFSDLLNDITANILGILPPLLIFNFAYEKLTQDLSAIEMSEQITETLMSNPQTIALFTEQQRKGFINSTIASIVDKRACEMVQGLLAPYLLPHPTYNIRSAFDYNIQLLFDIPSNKIFNKEDYFYIGETLQYTIHYLNDETFTGLPNDFYAGFFYDNEHLDHVLRNGKVKEECDTNKFPYIFRESLKIKKEDLDKICSLPDQELLEFFSTFIKLKIKIDNIPAEIINIKADHTGIKILFHSKHEFNKDSHSVRVVFHMAQLWDSEFQVALSDPTYSPKVQLSYQPDRMSVEMYSFFSDSIESSVGNALEKDNGMYSVVVEDKWIYPMSGMVFSIKRYNLSID
jgi:hypothetical protein